MADVRIPPRVLERMLGAYGSTAQKWADRFPDVLAEATRRWQLEVGPPFPYRGYHFVAPATRGTERLVVKLGVPNPEFSSEIEALRAFDGQGAARLLDADPDAGMLLLERIDPGSLLADVSDDDRAMAIAAEVMIRLWREPPAEHSFRTVRRWTQGLSQPQAKAGLLPRELVERAKSVLDELSVQPVPSLLLHGDFHQFNVLNGGPRGWLAIDPKGAVGDPGYDLGPLLRNLLLQCDDPARRLERRVRRLSMELSMDPERVLSWAFAGAVLSACWAIEDGEPWQNGLRSAELMGGMLGNSASG